MSLRNRIELLETRVPTEALVVIIPLVGESAADARARVLSGLDPAAEPPSQILQVRFVRAKDGRPAE